MASRVVFGKLSVLATMAAVAFCAAAESAEDAFAKIAALADEKAARAAIRNEASSAVLELIARKSKSWRLRADAVYFVREDSVRKDIFAGDSDWRVKAAAIFHMADAEFVERVACDENAHDNLRAAAVTKIRNRDILEKLKSSPSKRVRYFAARQLPPPFVESKVVPVPETTITDLDKVMVDIETVTRK